MTNKQINAEMEAIRLRRQRNMDSIIRTNNAKMVLDKSLGKRYAELSQLLLANNPI